MQSWNLPTLRSRGFKGSYPHLRRFVSDGIDLLTHDKWGGGFVIEIANAPKEGVTTTLSAAIEDALRSHLMQGESAALLFASIRFEASWSIRT